MIINLINSSQVLIIFISIYTIFINRGISAERVGYLYFEFLCYENLLHLDLNGNPCDSVPSKNCDPIFSICINHDYIDSIGIDKCKTYYAQTDSYDNHETVCNSERRGFLATRIIKEVPFIPKQWFIRIHIMDAEKWHEPSNIATFGYQFSELPSVNYSEPVFKTIHMYREDRKLSNSEVKMKISMGLRCDHDRYGKKCEIFCRPSNLYKCSSDGRKICNAGWKGENCDQRDLCFFQTCISGGKCIEIDNKAQCLCFGSIGPRCYPNYDPCALNPCGNGQCIPNKTGEVGFRCICNPHFYGSKCELNLCQIVPCHNNATCEYNEKYGRKCICLSGFTGVLCDHKSNFPIETIFNDTLNQGNSTHGAIINKNIHLGNIKIHLFLSFVILCILLTAIILIIFCKKRKKMWIKKNEYKFTMNELENKSNQRVISNEYFTKVDNESIYEVVKEENTYTYLQEENDDYLVPSRPTTPGFLNTPQNNDESDYLEMSNSFENSKGIIENKLYEKDVNLPPLPTREFKRKLSLSKFCMS